MLYFDTLMLAPRDMREVELIFVLQRDREVLQEVKPRLIRMAGVYPDFEEPYKQRIAFNYSYSLP